MGPKYVAMSFHSLNLLFVIGPVRFAEKISWNTIIADLLWEKNTILAKKTSWKVQIIRQANKTIIAVLVDIYQVHMNKEKEQKEKYATGARTKDCTSTNNRFHFALWFEVEHLT